jgi:hypothetical protein
MTKKDYTPSEVIDALGGTSTTARLCETTDAAVSQWRIKGIPKSRLMFLRLAAPGVFAELDAKPGMVKEHRKGARRSGKERRVVPTRRAKDLAK